MTDEQKIVFTDLARVQQRKENIIANANADIRMLAKAESGFNKELCALLGVEIPEPEEASPEEETEDAESEDAAES